jgi:hypothetical protein
MQALEVRRVSSSADLLKAGDFVFIPKREPEITVERIPLTPPTKFFAFIKWSLFGKKYELKQYVELRWPEHDAVIVQCPDCNSPCASTKIHKIISIEPLTVELPITCPYCKNVTFQIKDGKIMTA